MIGCGEGQVLPRTSHPAGSCAPNQGGTSMQVRFRALVPTIGFIAWSSAASADPAALAPAPVQATQSTQALATSEGTSDQDRVVCHVMGPPIGSRLGSRRECKT